MKTTIKFSTLAIFYIISILHVFSQVFPDDIIIDWSSAGLIHEIPEPNITVNVVDFGAVGNGVNNDSPAVQQALESLNGNPGILFFPEGSYLLTESIIAHSGLVIRGVGSEQSYLKFFLVADDQHAIIVSSAQTSSFQNVLPPYDIGNGTLNISSSEGWEAGDFLEIRQENGDWDIVPAAWAEKVVGQIIQVESVSGNEITLAHPLRFSYNSILNPEIRKIETINNVKVENLKIERLDEPQDGGGKNVYFSYAVNCQMSGVESAKSQGSHVHLANSSNILIFGNFFHDAFLYDGTDTRGYGITLNMHTGEVLAENNIFKNLRHAMMVKTGANGNVFSYNYSREPHRSEPINDYSGDISLHGHYAYANLFEENICQNIIIDHYWGPAGPYNTLFRNRTELYGLIMTNNDILETQNQNFIGNEITNNFPYGFYTITGSGHFEYGNNDGGTCIPAGTSDLQDISYHYSERPWFLSNEYPFPAIGYPSVLNQFSNPAKDRWLNGGLMTVEIESAVAVKEKGNNIDFIVQIRNNPCRQYLQLDFQNSNQNLQYRIYNMEGQLELWGRIESRTSLQQISLQQLSRGVYVIQIQSETKGKVLKFSKL